MRRKLLSISEITEIEHAYAHGAPTLGVAAKRLLERWKAGLRDEETGIRLMFLIWYALAEPGQLTGLLLTELPKVTEILTEFDDGETLSAEGQFGLGVLASIFPWCFGDEATWEHRATEFLHRAAEKEPESRLLQDAPAFVSRGESHRRPRIYLELEIHARFHGRGAYGQYMLHCLSSTLQQD